MITSKTKAHKSDKHQQRYASVYSEASHSNKLLVDNPSILDCFYQTIVKSKHLRHQFDLFLWYV